MQFLLRRDSPTIKTPGNMKLRSILGVALVGLALTQFSHAAIKAGDKLYIDFGKNDPSNPDGVNGIIMPSNAPMNTGAGNSTGVADTYGNYWNNAWTNTSSAGGPTPPPSLTNLITSTNVGTGVGLSFSKGWESNGFKNGGLMTPSFSLLGDFASTNATGDYFFINKPFTEGQAGIASMTFSNLNPNLTYDFQIFGVRAENQVRKTEYSITDINGIHSTILQTSGAGLGADGYNGNNNTFAYLTGIVPDALGNITLTVKVNASDYGYIGAMSITAVPEPEMYGVAAAAGCLALVMVRRRRRA